MPQGAEGYMRLLESVYVVPLDSEVALVRGRDVLRIRGSAEIITAVTDLLLAGVEHAALADAGPPELIGPLLGELDRRRWIARERPVHAGEACWQRQTGYLTLFGTDPAAMQQRIGTARVAIVGVGGIGGLVAQHLAGAGARRLVLADFDNVALHNLNRQYIFGISDIGERKTTATANALRRLSLDVECMLIEHRFEVQEDFRALPDDISALVMAADGPPGIMKHAWAWAAPRNVPVTTGAVGLGTGYWGPLLVPARGDCWHCFERQRTNSMSPLERKLETHLTEPTAHSFGPSNSVIAALVAHDLIRFLATGECATLGVRGVFDMLGMRVNVLAKPETECPHRAGREPAEGSDDGVGRHDG
jgi:ThiF family